MAQPDRGPVAAGKYDSINSEWRAVAEKIMGLYEQYHSTGNELYLEQAKRSFTMRIPRFRQRWGMRPLNWILFGKEHGRGADQNREQREGNFFAIIAAMVAATIGVLVLAFALIRNVTGPTEEVRNAWWALARATWISRSHSKARTNWAICVRPCVPASMF